MGAVLSPSGVCESPDFHFKSSSGSGDNAAMPETPYEWFGGEAKVREVVDRFYDLMDLEPKYAALRAAHGTELAHARDKLYWFLCGWLGGPSHYEDRFGHPRLRMRHMP